MSKISVLVHFDGKKKRSKGVGVVFCSEEPAFMYLDRGISLLQLKSRIHEKLQLRMDQQIVGLWYRMPISGGSVIQYAGYKIRTDEDIEVMMDSHLQFVDTIVLELYAEYAAGTSGNASSGRGNSSRDVRSTGGGSTEHGDRHENFDLGDDNDESDEAVYMPTDESSGEEGGRNNMINTQNDGDSQYRQSARSDIPVPEPFDPRSYYQTPDHMTHLDLNEMNAIEFPEYNLSSYGTSGPQGGAGSEFSVGMTYMSKEAAQLAIKHYSIIRNVVYRVFESDQQVYVGKCLYASGGCEWRIRVRMQSNTQWKIVRYNGPHTCSCPRSDQDHPMLDSEYVSTCILAMVRANPSIKGDVIRAEINNIYGYTISYKKAWKARQKAIKKVYGDFDESYEELPRWMMAMKRTNPGMVMNFQTLPATDQGDGVHRQRFHRLFWTFEQLIEGFKWCKPLLQVDGTHLYGKYKGVLMMATAQDGNQNIVPIAFQLAEGETTNAWAFFFENLKNCLQTVQGICVISDRHPAIKSAMHAVGWSFPTVHHMYCIRHIASNFKREFKNSEAEEYLVNAAYSQSKRVHDYFYGMLSRNPEYKVWIDDIEPYQWALIYDGGYRWGHMTTNLSECVNSMFKGLRQLPVTALVRGIFHRLAELFANRGRSAQEQLNAGHKYTEFIRNKVIEGQKANRFIRVGKFSHTNTVFEALETKPPKQGGSAGEYWVNLNTRTCDCGEFQTYRYPCRHAIAGCLLRHVDPEIFVNDVYRLNSVANVYNMEFNPTGHRDNWDTGDVNMVIIPNQDLLRFGRGRPRTSRIRNEMDLRERGMPQRCGHCRTEGHNKRQCPYRNLDSK